MESTTLLVTGATGLVGSHVARHAAAAGYEVHAVVRPSSDRRLLEDVPVRYVEADLARPETLFSALAEADVVVHAAAQVGDWGPAELYRAINVVALEQMIHAAAQHGRLRRWIQISSLGVYPARHHYGTDETTPPDLVGLDGYTRTKAEADVLLGHHVREHGFPAVILRPGFIYGEGSRHALQRLIDRISTGKMRMIGRGDRVLNNTSVHNLVDAVMLAIDTPDIEGETFNIRDERLVTREEFIYTICDYLGKPYPRRLPERLICRWWARSSGKPGCGA